jgi:hypothetical protein
MDAAVRTGPPMSWSYNGTWDVVCECIQDSDCSAGYECVDGVCEAIPDDPPTIDLGPFLAAGYWPVLPTDPDNPIILEQNHTVLWTFSDDKASCTEEPTFVAEYQAVGDSTWTALEGDPGLVSDWYAGFVLPVLSLTNATTYAVRFTVTDCADQSTTSGEYYFRVAYTDNPPVFESGPFIAAGSWQALPQKGTTPPVLSQNTPLLWTFSDDYASCDDMVSHMARYRKVGDTDWTEIEVGMDPWIGVYPYVELPILESGTYGFRMNMWDCLYQSAASPIYYFQIE